MAEDKEIPNLNAMAAIISTDLLVAVNGNIAGDEPQKCPLSVVITNLDALYAPITAIYAQLSDSTTQTPGTTNPTAITMNTDDEISGISHSAGVLTIDTTGVYWFDLECQVGKASGGTAIQVDIFAQEDVGAGYVDIDNTAIRITVKDSDRTDVVTFVIARSLVATDKIRFMIKVSTTTGSPGIYATAAVVGPPSVPATPSVILSIHKVGNA